MPPIRIVLCRPSHPGNIGAAARAMKAMGLSDLRLVQPERFPAPEAQWMATNAVDVLEAAKVHATLHEAIADCVAAFALSARSREWSPQVLDVRSAAARAVEMDAPVAFVFAHAVQGVAYEVRMCVDVAMPFARVEKRATVEDLEGLYAHLEDAATASGFMTPNSRLRERWRRLFSRVPALEREEVNILRGLLKALMQPAHRSDERQE